MIRLQSALSVLSTLALRGGGAGVAVLFTVLVSRYLSTTSAAQFFLLFNISTIAAVCFRWGLDEVIIRRVAKLSSENVAPTARHLTALSHRRVTLWALTFSLLFFTLFNSSLRELLVSTDALSITLALFASTMVALTACVARVLQGSGRTNLATFLLNVAMPGLSLLGLLLLVRIKEPNSRDLMILYACVALAIYIITTISRYGNPLVLLIAGFRIQWSTAESSAANKLGVVVLAQQVVGWTAFLIIPYVYGDSAYKGFVVVQKIATLISLTMLALNFTFSRRFAAMYAEGKLQELRRVVWYSLFAIMVASLVITILLTLSRHWLFSYAQLDTDMTSLLLILLASQVFFSVSALFSVVLSMAHDDNYLLVTQATINGIGALLIVIAAHFLPLEAASLTLITSYLVLSIALGMRVYRLTGTAKRG